MRSDDDGDSLQEADTFLGDGGDPDNAGGGWGTVDGTGGDKGNGHGDTISGYEGNGYSLSHYSSVTGDGPA